MQLQGILLRFWLCILSLCFSCLKCSGAEIFCSIITYSCQMSMECIPYIFGSFKFFRLFSTKNSTFPCIWSLILTSFGTSYWSLCDQYHGRKQQQPWQRLLDQYSISLFCLSVKENRELWVCVFLNFPSGAERKLNNECEVNISDITISRVNIVCPTLNPCLQLW